jgi:hypothetical protein
MNATIGGSPAFDNEDDRRIYHEVQTYSFTPEHGVRERWRQTRYGVRSQTFNREKKWSSSSWLPFSLPMMAIA